MGQPFVSEAGQDVVEQVRTSLRSPYLPRAVARLAEADSYLDVVWPRVAHSVDTTGFLGSALYMADMALDAVEEVYEPVSTVEDLAAAGLTPADRERLLAVVDVFHYVQPQVLLLLSALAEAMGRDAVGGHGAAEQRPITEREQRHFATQIPQASPDIPPLPEACDALGLDEPPDLYRAIAAWPAYLGTAWEELQHLAAYPDFRRRGRALYFYARSGARFLAEPLQANPAALREAGVSEGAIEEARTVLDRSLPELAMMMMHAEAMRLGLGVTAREVVKVG